VTITTDETDSGMNTIHAKKPCNNEFIPPITKIFLYKFRVKCIEEQRDYVENKKFWNELIAYFPFTVI
jgi:hypothetical protein